VPEAPKTIIFDAVPRTACLALFAAILVNRQHVRHALAVDAQQARNPALRSASIVQPDDLVARGLFQPRSTKKAELKSSLDSGWRSSPGTLLRFWVRSHFPEASRMPGCSQLWIRRVRRRVKKLRPSWRNHCFPPITGWFCQREPLWTDRCQW
jgi:hypothetical protein